MNDMFMASMNVTGFDETGQATGLLVVATFQTFSEGWVRITSPDPLAQPEVEINMLADERDTVRLRDGYKRLLRIAHHPAVQAISDGFTSQVTGEAAIGDVPDAELDAWLLANCSDTQHPVGTCRMGPPDQGDAVVDPDCRVLGVEGLSVADASIMPQMVRANTHLTSVMIGEHVAARRRISANR